MVTPRSAPAVILGLVVLCAPSLSLATRNVLFYGPTYFIGCEESLAPNITVTVWDVGTWTTKATGDFAAFDAIVFADGPPPGCADDPAVWAPAISNRAVWSAAVRGNVIVIGADPDWHAPLHPGAAMLARNGVDFAASGAGGTGLYVVLGCMYDSAPPTSVALLDDLGTFVAQSSGHNDDCHKVASHPALAGITDAGLSNWNWSTHDLITSWPAGYIPLAIAVHPLGMYTAGDGVRGNPYIVASGANEICSAAMTVATVMTPFAPKVGDRVTYRIVVTNEGDPLGKVMVVDTISPVLTGVTRSQPLGFTALAPASVGSGTWYGWTGSGLYVPTGVSLTFTLTGMVSRVCTLKYAPEVAQVTASGFCGGEGTVTSNHADFVLEAPTLYLTVTNTQSPANPGVGDALSYRIVVRNAGEATVTALTVTDTVSPALLGQAAYQPSGFGAPLVTQQPGTGTRYTWSATGLSMKPGASFTFTITGTVGPVCVPLSATSRAYVEGVDECGRTATLYSGPTGFDLPGTSVTMAVTRSPASPEAGDAVTYRIVVTNDGSVTATDLVVADTVSPVLGGVGWEVPPGFTALGPVETASGTWYGWSRAGVPFPPRASLTLTITGIVGDVCAGAPVPIAIGVTGIDDCGAFGIPETGDFVVGGRTAAVTIRGTLTPASPGMGEAVTYRIVVTNTGSVTLTGVAIADTVSAVVTGVLQDAPPGFAALGPAQAASGTWYGWTGTALAFLPGTAFTFTLTGVVGSVCTVTPVSGTAFVHAGTPCTSTVVAASFAGFTARPLPAAVGLLKVQAPASGAALTAGSPVSYAIHVANTGASTITDLTVVDTVPPVVLGQSASPVAGFAIASSGSASGSLWVWAGSGISFPPGMTLTLTVTGTVGTVCADTSVPGTAPTVLAGTGCSSTRAQGNATAFTVGSYSIAVSAAKTSVPVAPVAGQAVTYRILLTNTGTVTVTDLLVVDTISPVVMNASASQPVGVPPPLVTQGAAGTIYAWTGTGLSFQPGATWTFTVTGLVWVVGVNTTVANRALVRAAGSCAATGAVSNLTTFAAPAFIPANLVAVSLVLSPAGVTLGEPLTATLVLRNAGGAALTVTTYAEVIGPGSSPGLGVAPAPAPSPPFVLAGGESASVVWTHPTGGACGTAFVQAMAGGTEATTGRALLSGVAISNVAGLAGSPTHLSLAPTAASAEAGTQVRLVARVTDACGVGVPNLSLAFTPVGGGGAMATPVLTTDVSGQASPLLVLGAEPGPNVVWAVLAGPVLNATTTVTGTSSPLALASPGAALDRNVIVPDRGDVVIARICTLNADPVTVKIYTASGKLVRTLRGERFRRLEAGQFVATWDGRTEDEFPVARGVYLIRVMGGGVNQVLKVIVK